MCFYIGIEDLAANALIELLEKDGKREVSFRALTQYGTAVVKILNDKDQDAILLLSRERTTGFLHNCTHLFDVVDFDSPEAKIVLRNGVTADDLAREFCGSISMTVLTAMISEKPLKVLFDIAA